LLSILFYTFINKKMKKLLYVTLLGIALVSCNNQNMWNIKPSGEQITDTLSGEPFQILLNNSSANIEFDSTIDENKIIVTGDKNFITNLSIENQNNTLNISNKKKVSFNTKTAPLFIKINSPELQKAVIAGNGSITTNNVTLTNDIEFEITGAGEINVKLNNDITSIFVSGVGNVRLHGKSNELKAKMSGAGNLNAEDLVNKQAIIEISGTGNARVQTTDEINAKISGIGSLKYKNYEQLKVVEKISGIGSIEPY